MLYWCRCIKASTPRVPVNLACLTSSRELQPQPILARVFALLRRQIYRSVEPGKLAPLDTCARRREDDVGQRPPTTSVLVDRAFEALVGALRELPHGLSQVELESFKIRSRIGNSGRLLSHTKLNSNSKRLSQAKALSRLSPCMLQ